MKYELTSTRIDSVFAEKVYGERHWKLITG